MNDVSCCRRKEDATTLPYSLWVKRMVFNQSERHCVLLTVLGKIAPALLITPYTLGV